METYDLVVQEDLMGCGIACVASRIGRTYEETKQKFSRPENSGSERYYCQDLIEVLKQEGFDYDFKKVEIGDESILKRAGAIVFVKRSFELPVGHWLLRTPIGWMNPWVNFVSGLEENVFSARSGYEEELPGDPEWMVYEIVSV